METKKKTYREIRKFNQSVIHNFEVSVVMPFYHKLEVFKKVLPKNAPYLQRNGIEVIIVMDGPTEEEGLIELIKQYPFMNWKVILNEKEYESRNPAPVLNVGIRHATKKYFFVSGPEVEFYTDVILELRNMLEHYPGHYATGTVAFIEEADVISDDHILLQRFIDYGSIMVEKKALEEIGAYEEGFKVWGGEDDNIRRRLEMKGIKQLRVPQARSLHREEKLQLQERFVKTNGFRIKEWRQFFYPQNPKANGESWGLEFNKLVYDWQNNQHAEELCCNYLKDFKLYEIKDSSVFKEQYKKLILCQAYNETEFMEGFLEDMARYFDGIILLDDGSTDNTWKLAKHEKILLKVKKKRECFNDLENRNILLNLASFFKSEWFCFMDIDERFDERYVDFGVFENDRDVDVVAFKGVYLWEDENTYASGTPYSKDGIIKIIRMFRNNGYAQIKTHKEKLHFAACPYYEKIFNAKILFKDYGVLSETKRKKKYEMYNKEDESKDLSDYEYLINGKVKLNKIEDIKID